MQFDHTHYISCLRWKQGEYQAISRLNKETKALFTPLIEIPEIGWDFEIKKQTKTIDEHLKDFALKRICKKWGTEPCFIDLKLLSGETLTNGIHPVNYIFNDLKNLDCEAIPVTGLDRDQRHQAAIKKIVSAEKTDLCIRMRVEDAAKSSVKSDLEQLLSYLNLKISNCHFILDLGTPSFEPLEGFLKVIYSIYTAVLKLGDWRSLTIMGSSFPRSMGEIKEKVEILKRSEWRMYKKLVEKLRENKLRLPTFGDYAVSHPEIVKIDMRLLKPFATIRYTLDDAWMLIKGKNIRDHEFGQYRDLCQVVLDSGKFCGADYSWGDKYIEDCAKNRQSTGTLSIWRQVGTNHHIEKVTEDIANFFAA